MTSSCVCCGVQKKYGQTFTMLILLLQDMVTKVAVGPMCDSCSPKAKKDLTKGHGYAPLYRFDRFCPVKDFVAAREAVYMLERNRLSSRR